MKTIDLKNYSETQLAILIIKIIREVEVSERER